MHRENQQTSCPGDEPARTLILVVSADAFGQDFVCRGLQQSGYRVSVASDGATAQRLLREHAFDLVILDGIVPGKDTREVVSEIRIRRPGADLPAVLVAADDDSDASRFLAHGVDACIKKPFEIGTLATTIETQLARRHIGREPKRSRNDLERLVAQRTTELERANRELEEARSVLTDALEVIDEGFALWDSEDQLVSCNESYRKLFGPNAKLVIPGARFEDLMRWQLQSGALRGAVSRPHEWLEQRVSRHRDPHGPFEDEFSDGTWVQVAETRTTNGYTVGICTEISQVKRREMALKTFAENNRRLAAAVNATSSTILITDPNRPGNPTVFANPAFTAMTGWPVEEALGRDRSFLSGPDTDTDEAARFEQDMCEGRPASTELRLNARNGRSFWAEINASPMRGNDGRISNWVIIQTNITARKKTEEQLHQSQKMEMIGQLTGGLAHDLNNLLTIVLGNLESAHGAAGTGDSEAGEMLESALAATRRGADVTRRLLAFSRQQTPAPKVTDLRETLNGFEKFIGRSLGSGYRLRLVRAAELWPVMVEPGQLENAILNLAINARDSMLAGGTLTLEAANTVLKNATDVTGQPIADGEYVCISVGDSGDGMSPEIVERVIQPFFTTKETGKGTGLGLSMVYGFTSQSGGSMQIDSVPRRGTKVFLFFPRVRAACDSGDTASRAQSAAGSETLLVVDDEPEVRAVAAMQLTRLGYRVLQAGDAEEALRVFESDGPVDLLVTDIGLSGGMNGYQLVAAIRARQPNARAILVSGSCLGATPSATQRDPSVGFLAKPYDRAALASAVLQALNTDPLHDRVQAELLN
ncbi:MAG: response regulator [Alphaproteobacteria bacterium]|nr:response regulator [Alphaproteobacteria bacterium]